MGDFQRKATPLEEQIRTLGGGELSWYEKVTK